MGLCELRLARVRKDHGLKVRKSAPSVETVIEIYAALT